MTPSMHVVVDVLDNTLKLMSVTVSPPEADLKIRKISLVSLNSSGLLRIIFSVTLLREGRRLIGQKLVEICGYSPANGMQMAVASFHECRKYYRFMNLLMMLQFKICGRSCRTLLPVSSVPGLSLTDDRRHLVSHNRGVFGIRVIECCNLGKDVTMLLVELCRRRVERVVPRVSLQRFRLFQRCYSGECHLT